mgnify:CR=1 FL=1
MALRNQESKTFTLKRIRAGTRLFLKGGLFHPLAIIIAIFIVFSCYNIVKSTGYQKMVGLYLSLDSFLLPIYVLQAAFHVIRDAKTTIFELNLLKDWYLLFFSRLLALGIAITPLLLALAIILYLGNLSHLILPLIVRFITYISIAALAMLLQSRKGSLLFLVVSFIILPFGAQIIFSYTSAQGEVIDPILSIVLYFLAPITSTIYCELLSLNLTLAQLLTILTSLIIILLSAITFKKLEYEI